MPLTTFPIILEEAYMISPKVKHFVFKCTIDPVFDYLPGQFITIHFDHQGKSLKRSYSIANAPQQDNKIEFAAGFFAGGPGTELLFNLKQGDVLHCNGPFGRLILKEEHPKRYIFAATSTGVTPYRAMLSELQQFLNSTPRAQVVILQGVQTREEILYHSEFLAFAACNPKQFTFIPCLSRQNGELQNNEHGGYVQHALQHMSLNPNEDIVYLCGNPGMIDATFDYLKEHNFTLQQIIREKYLSR